MLRNLALSLLIGIAATNVVAQETENNKIEFAPGAQGHIETPVMQLIDRAKEQGNQLKNSLRVQEPAEIRTDLNIEELRQRALNNPRVRALLGADGEVSDNQNAEARYGSDRAFILLSFSMPETSLRSVMVEAERFGIPIVMRGFVKNSAYATQTAIQRVFKDDAESIGFNIDPTMFTRFNVTSVPQLIVVSDDLLPCETQGCEQDVAPLHDVVKGNIPIEAGLRIIAEGDGDASFAAQSLLAKWGG